MEVHMKKFKSITLAVLLSVSFLATSTHASDINADVPAEKDSFASSSVITDALRDRLDGAADDERIPVTIELIDDIDLENVERQAISRAKLSKTQLEIINTDTSSFSEEVNEVHQQAVMDVREEISFERNAILKEHYTEKNAEFMEAADIPEDICGSVGILTPFIRDVLLTPAQIRKLAVNPDVRYIDYLGEGKLQDFASVDDTYAIVNGDVAVNAGYTGSGIRVGVIETGHPKLGLMGNDFKSIIKTNSGEDSDHATRVCGIIRKMAPACILYSRTASSTSEALNNCSYLIDKYNVSVINLSCGETGDGKYNAYSREMDNIVNGTKVTIVASAGNGKADSQYINQLGLSANVITVGAVISAGKNPGATGAFMLTDYSLYREAVNVVNKPDVCAPGKVSIYSLGEAVGTSFAAPHVTGAVVQMIARDSNMKEKPESLKAAVMASASYNAGSSMSYVMGTRASDQEGAGVLDAGFCYRTAKNSRLTFYKATSSSTIFNYNIYCDYTTLPVRLACVWNALSANGTTNITDYDVYVYKDGTLIASSTGYSNASSLPRTNFEIIEIPQATISKYGRGYYNVQIKRVGSFKGEGDVMIGFAWEQR